MNRFLEFLSLRLWASVLGGLLLIGFGGFYCLDNSVTAENLPEQHLALGKLAYMEVVGTQSGGFPVIGVANADGSGRTRLTSTPPSAFNPSWSPDGTRIVYMANSDIFVMLADGTNQANLTNTSQMTESLPSWSVSGKIAFERDGRIWTMNANGTNQAQFAAITQVAGNPVWSPDGTKLAYVSGGEIWKINADGTNQQRVTTNNTQDAYLSWSPDAAKIVFDKGSTGIAVVNADGTNETYLTTVAFDSYPSWSPDGSLIAFRRSGTSQVPGGIYTMNSSGGNQTILIANNGTFPQSNSFNMPSWQPVAQPRRTAFDFDADGKADISVFRPSNGVWYRINSSDNSFYAAQFGAQNDVIAPADYDGDGKTDFAVFRPVVLGAGAQAYFYILNSADNSFRTVAFGTQGDKPFPGDWDGDGKADAAVYRAAIMGNGQSYFYYRPSSQPTVDFNTQPLGTAGDNPVPADYDGDGRIDAAVFRPSNAAWIISRSSNNQSTQTFFGLPNNDIPVPADFDGDGQANLAVFRPSTGTWYTSQNPAINYGAIQFGASSDLPVAADYDGDGKADVAVYRPSNGAWYILRSTAGFTGIQFGASTDKPVPAAYIP